jgi:hypothetical protein
MRFVSGHILRRTRSILRIFNKTKDVNPVSNIACAILRSRFRWRHSRMPFRILESLHGNGGSGNMNTSRRAGIIIPLVSIMAAFALSAQAEEGKGPPEKGVQGKPAVQAARPGPGRPGPGAGRGPQDAHFARGGLPARNFGGRAYHGHLAWEGGRWRHEIHNGREGWWWDVGGAWYFYPQPMEGPPAYVSEVEIMDDVGPVGPPVAGGYPPPPGYYPPPPAAYVPPPPPPPPDPAASAVGGAMVGGLLGGLISGRPSGAIAGAVAGGTVGAIAGAQAAARPGYYLAQGGCYYRYPSGQYVQVDPRSCY